MNNHLDGVIGALLAGGAPFMEIDLDGPHARSVYALLAAKRAVVDPTLTLSEMFVMRRLSEPGATRLPPELARALAPLLAGPDATPAEQAEQRRAADKLIALVGAMHRHGVSIVAGTDVCIPGHSLHREIELYVDAGLTPLEALQSATIVPARAMGLEKELGTLEPGKRADLLVLDASPLERISNIRSVRFVITEGRMCSSDLRNS